MAIGESKREVRITWIGFTVIFTIIGSILLYRERSTFQYFYVAAGFFGFFAAVAPMALLPLYKVWIRFAAALGRFNTKLLLGLVYFLVLTPIGLALKLAGKDLLDEKLDKSAETYWKPKERHDDPSRYEKQY